MPKYVAFLRAINVGGHTVTMDLLRELFSAIGCAKVETFIASGNVIFASNSKNAKALEQKIEKHLKASLGYEVVTFIRAVSELAAIAERNPFGTADLDATGGAIYIAFVSETPSAEAIRKLLSCASNTDDFRVHGREVYWLIRANFSDSAFSGARLEKTLGMSATVRNSTTVRKLAAKYS